MISCIYPVDKIASFLTHFLNNFFYDLTCLKITKYRIVRVRRVMRSGKEEEEELPKATEKRVDQIFQSMRSTYLKRLMPVLSKNIRLPTKDEEVRKC